MAKLPSKYDLSQQPSGRSGRQIAEYNTSGLGRGLQSLGNSLSVMADDMKRQQNTVDVARAEAAKAKGFIDTENEFSQDGDYSTFGKRAPVRTGGVVDNAANLIRDPAMRERWKIGAQTDAARVNDAIGDKARTLGKQAETVAFDDALETNRRIYVDPNSSEEARAKARADIEGAISTGEKSGLLTPDQGAARRDKFVRDADFSRAKLAVDRDPSVVAKPLPATVGQRASSAMGFFTTRGWSKEQAAGIVGNLIAESQLNTGALNGGDGADGSDSIGVAQWNSGRATALKNFAAQSGKDWRDFETQLAFVDHELRNSPSERAAFNALQSAKDVQSAAEAMIMYERPRGSDQGVKNAHNYRGRVQNAFQAAGIEPDPEWFNRLSPEQRQVVYNQAETRRREIAVEQRGNIETVVQNAPVALQNTGTYDGSIPTRDQFMDAYGAQDGSERYDKFQAAMDVGQQAFNFRTMSVDDIQSMVNEAKPTSSGNDAALQEARYDALSKAATATLTARKADPATYTQQAFPAVAQAWTTASETGNYQAAMNATAAAQQQLGIRDMKLLPKAVADQAVTSFKNPDATDDQRLGAVSSLIFSTADQGQRQAVFNQLVDAGLPAMTEGAIEAAARGDSGAANRLLQAALTDTGKLPKAGDVKPADIDDALYSSVWAPGAVGDASYGVAYGDAASLERAQRGGELMKKAVQLRISQGQDLETAVSGASKDLFGDVKVYDGSYGVNANLPVPSDTDDDALYNGLNSAKTSFKAALELQRQRILDGSKAAVPDGGKAILDTTTLNSVDDILETGVFVSTGNGIGLRDPYTGVFIPGADGVTPLSIPLQTILDMGKSAPARSAPDFAPTPQNTPKSQQDIDAETYGTLAPLLKSLENGQ